MKRKFTYFIVALMMTIVYATTATAAAIQQIGDRYIIHVDELNLSGEETLAEVLAMFPNVIDFRGEVFGANAAVRVNDYGLSTHNMVSLVEAVVSVDSVSLTRRETSLSSSLKRQKQRS